MTRLALRNLASRPLRTILTTLAILLGVAMITGTYVLTDQINNGFSNIFETSFKGTAVQSSSRRHRSPSLEGDAHRRRHERRPRRRRCWPSPASTRPPGSTETIGAAIVDGKTVQTGGAPTLLTTADPGEPFDQATLVAGREIQRAQRGRDHQELRRRGRPQARRELRRRRPGRPPGGHGRRRLRVGRLRLPRRHHRRRRPPGGRAALGRRAGQASAASPSPPIPA